jgi:hypothetical protein
VAADPASIVSAPPAGGRRVAATFDDGPAASTDAVLDVLGFRDDGHQLVTVSELLA